MLLLFNFTRTEKCSSIPSNTLWGCPNNYIIPDCNYIISNKDYLCNYSMDYNMILSGTNCTLHGKSLGCNLFPLDLRVNNYFCCSLTSTPFPSLQPSSPPLFNPQQSEQPSSLPLFNPQQSEQPSSPPFLNPQPPQPLRPIFDNCNDCNNFNMSDYNDYLSLLEYLNTSQAEDLFNSVNQIRQYQQQQTQIEDVVHHAGVLVLNSLPPNSRYEKATDNFHFYAMPVNFTQNKPLSLEINDFRLDLPQINIPDSAISVIQWQLNPYMNMTDIHIDSNVVSVVLSEFTGTQIPTQALATPIQLKWSLNLSPTDPRIKQQIRTAKCGHSGQIISISCPSGNGTYNCSNTETLKAVCQKPASYNAECLYWNTTNKKWDSYGCTPIYANATYSVCNCSHLTSFSTRIHAVYDSNKDIFESFTMVYSLAGFQKYQRFFIIFGTIAGIAVLAFGLGQYLDIEDSKRYFQLLFTDTVIQKLSKNYIIDVFEKEQPQEQSNPQASTESKTNIDLHPSLYSVIWNRILFQHSQIGAFLRFDPRQPRLFRLFIVFIALFNSLFLTGFMYSYTYGLENETVPAMTLVDSVILSLITACLNYPSQIIFNYIVNLAGYAEFSWRYPVVMEEIKRRHDFENEVIGFSEEELKLENIDFEEFKKNPFLEKERKSNIFIKICHGIYSTTQTYFSDFLTLITCHKKSKTKILTKGSIKRAIHYANQIIKNPETKPQYMKYIPFHTPLGGFVFLSAIGWFAWCLNYLILFSSYHSESVSDGILISFGLNELQTIVIIQPIVLIFHILIGLGLRKLRNNISFCKSEKPAVPNMYFSSDPYAKIYSTEFSTKLPYDIFLNIPSLVSHSGKGFNRYVKNLGYAQLDSVLDYIDDEKNTVDNSSKEMRIKELYDYIESSKNPCDKDKAKKTVIRVFQPID